MDMFQVCIKLLAFSHLDNNELFLEMENKANLLNSTPSFTIQSLLDEMPGQNFETNDFLAENISSKYFTPAEFLECKFPPNKFSMLHINISSLSKHIDELRNLLFVLSHPFDIIGVTETRLHETDPLSNIIIIIYCPTLLHIHKINYQKINKESQTNKNLQLSIN